MYFLKCNKEKFIINNKINWGAWMGVKKAILGNFSEQDLVIVKDYFEHIDYKSMSIYQAIKEAYKYRDEVIKSIREEETSKLQVQNYKDFDLQDFL